MLIELIKKSRINLWWNHIIAPLTLALYIHFSIEKHFNFQLYFTFLFASAFLAFLGYLINDFFDIKKDLLANKSNFFENINKTSTYLIVLIVLFITLVLWFFVPILSKYKFLIICFELLLLLVYSMPFFRLKEKDWFGVVADSLYAHILPWLMIALISPIFQVKYFIVILVFWQFFIGLRNILTHQINDYNFDLQVNNTLATKKSIKTIEKYISLVAFFEIISFSFFLYYLTFKIENEFIYPIIASLFIAVIYEIRLFANTRKNTLYFGFLNNIYEYLLPLSFCIFMAIKLQNYYLIFFHIVLFPKFYFYLAEIFSLKKNPDFSKIKLTGNYIIYYLFLIFGVNLKKEKKSALEYLKFKLRKQ